MLVKHNNNSISNLTSAGQLAQGKMTLISEQTASGSASISFTSGTLYMRFKATVAASGDGTGTSVISFTNNGVTNSDLDLTYNFT